MLNIQIYPKNSKLNNEVYKMPWRHDATCYNFHGPDVFIPDDEIDEKITDPMDVDTLVVTADLEDYGFIAKMKNLRQIYLYNAKNLTNLSFMEELIYLRQVCIMHSKVRCLDGLDALLINKNKAIDSGIDDFQARITYGIEGIFIHSDESSVRLTSLHDYGVYIGEMNINLYTGESSDLADEQIEQLTNILCHV